MFSRIIGIVIIFASLITYTWTTPCLSNNWTTIELLLISAYAIIYAFSPSFGVLLFVYKGMPIYKSLRNLFRKAENLKIEEIKQYISIINFFMKISVGCSKILIFIAIIRSMLSLSYDANGGYLFLNTWAFLCIILIAYLFILCAVYLICTPARQIYELKIKKLQEKQADNVLEAAPE